VAILLSLLLIFSAVAVSLAIVDLQVNFTANFAASQLKGMPTDLKFTGYDIGPGNGALVYRIVMVPFNGTQNMYVLINQPYLGASTRNVYVEMGNDSALNAQEVPVEGFIVVTRQNSTYVLMQPPVCLPGPLWRG
jgi:hypothetical protein